MKTILVAEDNENQLLLYKQELTREGYNVITAKDGYEAVERVEKFQPDLVVIDINLPKVSGIDSIGKILSEHRRIPIIIYTAYEHYKNSFMSWSADAYLIKTSDLRELKDKIKELLGKFS